MPLHRSKKETLPPSAQSFNLNQIVAYNLRAARVMRGWSQGDLAERLEGASGRRVTTSTVSSLERTWDGERPRRFDVHEVILLAHVLDVPLLWFFLPPPGFRGRLDDINISVLDLYVLVFGRNDQIEPMIERLREFGVHDPTPEDETVEKITGLPSCNRQRSYRERRRDFLLAVLDARSDDLERAADEIGDFFDHLRQVGLRGFIAEKTNDPIFALRPEYRESQGDSVDAEEAGDGDDEISSAPLSDI